MAPKRNPLAELLAWPVTLAPGTKPALPGQIPSASPAVPTAPTTSGPEPIVNPNSPVWNTVPTNNPPPAGAPAAGGASWSQQLMNFLQNPNSLADVMGRAAVGIGGPNSVGGRLGAQGSQMAQDRMAQQALTQLLEGGGEGAQTPSFMDGLRRMLSVR